MLVSTDADREFQSPAPPRAAATLETFLADIGTRAFRFAEAGLSIRDDALDSVQDAMIAAICLFHDATLATRNTKDFEGLDLKLVNPFEEA